MTTNTTADLPRGGRFILGVLIFGVLATLAYWIVWFGVDREILASAHTESYYAFENSFPAADAWMVACGVAAIIALLRRRASSFLWIISAGATSIYLGLLDVLFDLENGIYRSPDSGGVCVEIAINVLTLAFGTVIVIWAWRSRRELARLHGW
jgi:nicotinamide riboside transporter PnuC